ncbi:glycolate oxidase subunit GlcE [Acidovorax sp. SRB_24]|uniref:glycolate oxidase subunit GlcE n=1 Tax=Acidovorax sp. SRB_24 TaxID=1962700 RepID=UPI00145EFE2A|nr:glycolate oxidase subunit GlcE [Acidovorax sp. SRB_24]NMM79025.1 glycolate oxidase subunit GlcE [Acidovorax sp. SRB_24]
MDTVLSQITDRVREAATHQTALRIRGGGSKDFHGGAALRGEVLDTRAYTGIVSYEPSELVVTARAGTPLAELEAALAEKHQCLPFEPPHFGPGATVGGMVAAGLSGPARASVGAVRDFMLGVQLLNGRAEHLTFGGQVMKNVAGYDVSRLMAGAWGTLGVLTEVSIKVLPVAPAEATLRFACGQAEALTRLHAWGGQPLPFNASCWVEDAGVGQLYVRLRGAVAAVEAACKSMGGERLDNAAVAADWNACREQRLPWFAARAQAPQPGLDLWRLSVPATAPVLALPAGVAPPLVEWHGALRWVQAPRAHAQALHDVAAQVGGSATLFRASDAGTESAEAVFGPKNAALEKIQARLRQAFDPAGIFNPARGAALG